MWDHIKFIQYLKSLLSIDTKILVIKCFVLLQKNYYRAFGKELFPGQDASVNKKVYLLLSTDYSNLGDHAMTYAHRKYLEEHFSEYDFIEVLVSDTYKFINSIKSNLNSEDVFTLKGGGNIGIEYFREELYRRDIVTSFVNNRVIIFPQTIYFPNTSLGNKEFNNTIDVFRKNKNLTLLTRDRVSFDLVKEYLGGNVLLTPDIVHSLDDIEFEDTARTGVLTAMREDVEGLYSDSNKDSLIRLLEAEFSYVNVSDTTTDYPISLDMRETELFKIWKDFSSAEVVITDRLHGMIFAAITNTPCIVFKTYNYKLTAQYEWMKDLQHIKMIDFDLESLPLEVRKMKSIKISKRVNYSGYFYSAIVNNKQYTNE